jgi:hypothetical protein
MVRPGPVALGDLLARVPALGALGEEATGVMPEGVFVPPGAGFAEGDDDLGVDAWLGAGAGVPHVEVGRLG